MASTISTKPPIAACRRTFAAGLIPSYINARGISYAKSLRGKLKYNTRICGIRVFNFSFEIFKFIYLNKVILLFVYFYYKSKKDYRYE